MEHKPAACIALWGPICLVARSAGYRHGLAAATCTDDSQRDLGVGLHGRCADALYGGRWFRTLNVIDEGNRQALGIEVATWIPSARVIRVLDQLIEMHGKPKALRAHNGSEITSIAFTEWRERRQIQLWYIEPGKPDQNAFVERFNRTHREEVIDAHLFDSIAQVRDLTDSWIPQYNEERPHDSLGRVPPLTFMPRETHTESTLPLCA